MGRQRAKFFLIVAPVVGCRKTTTVPITMDLEEGPSKGETKTSRNPKEKIKRLSNAQKKSCNLGRKSQRKIDKISETEATTNTWTGSQTQERKQATNSEEKIQTSKAGKSNLDKSKRTCLELSLPPPACGKI